MACQEVLPEMSSFQKGNGNKTQICKVTNEGTTRYLDETLSHDGGGLRPVAQKQDDYIQETSRKQHLNNS